MKDKKVVFMGTPDFAVPILETLINNTTVCLVVTQPDKEVGRKREIMASPIKKLALKNNIKVFQPKRIKDDYEPILNENPDVIITCAYGQIIPKILLDTPKYKAINVHASLLPKYRGGAPIHRAIMNGEKESGVTIMYMDETMDTGDIIVSSKLAISDDDNVGSLHDKLSELGSKLLTEVLPDIFSETNRRIKQNNDEATYAPIIKRKDETIDFNCSGKDILNQIRGLNPWPLANIVINDQEMKVLKASFLEKNSNEEVGTIVEVTKNTLGIKCLNGVVYLEEVKPTGKNTMDIKSYLNGVDKNNLLKKRVKTNE